MSARRFIAFETHTSSIQLEKIFWDCIESLSANGRWQDWVLAQESSRPQSQNRASYLRTLVVKALRSGEVSYAG
jgi:predicted DNA-binding ribbon-helix-helix protein